MDPYQIDSKASKREQKLKVTKSKVEDTEEVIKQRENNINIQRIIKEKEQEVKKAHKEMQKINGQIRKARKEDQEPSISHEKQMEIAKEIDERIKRGEYR